MRKNAGTPGTDGQNNANPSRPMMYVSASGHIVSYQDGAGIGFVLLVDGSWRVTHPYDQPVGDEMKVQQTP